MPIIDSGERREFDSGAVRDIQEGKGRCDLLPLGVIALLLEPIYGDMYEFVLISINDYLRTGNPERLSDAIVGFGKAAGIDIPTLLLEVSVHYEEGCKKYGARNWEKGIPIYCYIDSAVRHLLKYLRGDQDERHDRAFVWNLLGASWTHRAKPEELREELPFFDMIQEEKS